MIAIDVAQSGLMASMMRLNASASNVVNADSVGSIAATSASLPASGANAGRAAYQPLAVDQQTVSGGGVTASYGAVQPASVARYDPSSSMADASGMVAAPNVDLVGERIQQITARYDFQANIEVIHAADEMQKASIDLLA